MLRLKRRNIWDHYCLVQHTSAVANYEYFKGLSITRLRAHIYCHGQTQPERENSTLEDCI